MEEMRPPLAAILADTEALLRAGADDPVWLERLIAIRTQARHLLQRFGPGVEPTPGLERVGPEAPAEEVVALMSAAATARGLDLECVGEGDLPRWIDIDATAVRLVLNRLLANAVTFTDHGRILVRVTCTTTGPLVISYAVMDTGIGMDADRLARLAAPQTQTHQDAMESGLASARRLAARIGGSLAFASTAGQGTTVTLLVPVGAAEPQTPAVAVPTPAEALLIGLEPSAHLALGAMLKRAGVGVRSTGGIDEAIALLEQGRRGRRGGQRYLAAFVPAGVVGGPIAAAMSQVDAGCRLVAVGEGILPEPCSIRIPLVPDPADIVQALAGTDHPDGRNSPSRGSFPERR